jgi:hypothetical protein
MKETSQTLITRLPYAEKYDPQEILTEVEKIDKRGLIFVSIPICVDSPNNGGALIAELEKAGLFLVAKVAWHRDKHIVTITSKRLTNTWEPIAVFARTKDYIINRDAPAKTKKGFKNRAETAWDEDEYLTCLGDHWAVRNDLADRRWLPQTVVLNCIQLADLQPGHTVYDPYGNPGIKKTCETFNWNYLDGGRANPARRSGAKKKKEEINTLELLNDIDEILEEAETTED